MRYAIFVIAVLGLLLVAGCQKSSDKMMEETPSDAMEGTSAQGSASVAESTDVASDLGSDLDSLDLDSEEDLTVSDSDLDLGLQ